MLQLAGKNVVVLGGSGGIGKEIVRIASDGGARVLAVGRRPTALAELQTPERDVGVLALDAANEDAPEVVFNALMPNVLVVCSGAIPPTAPLHQQSWQEFAINKEADVKISFHFCKAALLRPLSSGAVVVLISSGAGLGGSPISGGYAGAKRMQMFIANYSQKESDRLGLGVRFLALAPAHIMPETTLGAHAVTGYSRYLGISASDFTKSLSSTQTPSDVARAVFELAASFERPKGNVFVVSGKGVEALSQ